MTEDEKRLLQEEFTKAGSVPALLEAMAQAETKEFRDLRDQVEHGPHHPTGDELYEYVLGWLHRQESLLIMDHLVLCGRCLREVIKIRRLEEELTEDALARADRVPWLDRVKSFISKLSFPFSLYILDPERVRGATSDDGERRYPLGATLGISMEAPADGYVTVFHGCEETGKVDLAFPREADDDPRVFEGQEMPPIHGKVEGPSGTHWFKIIWTRVLVLDPARYRLGEVEDRERASAAFFDGLEKLSEEDRRVALLEYFVVEA